MKIKLTLLILAISVTIAVAQTRISLNSKISFEMPDGTVKFEDTEHLNKMKEAFGNELAQSLRKNTSVFKYGDIEFTFKVVEKISANFIQNSSKSLDKVYGNNNQTLGKSKEKLYKEYSKSFKKSEDGEIVFATYREEEKEVLNFTYYNSAKKIAFSAQIVYNVNDKAKAQQIFDRLYESIIIK